MLYLTDMETDVSKALMVFLINIATVIGPTLPGTGVIEEHIGATRSKSTSPTKRNPDFFLESGIRLIPTSITETPSLTISGSTKLGLPIAAIRMSARLVKSGKFEVLEWQKVTVELPGKPFLSISIPAGFPTIKLRPRITTCFPSVSIRDLFQKFQNAGRSTRYEAIFHLLAKFAKVGSIESIDIFERIYRVKNLSLIHLVWQGCLN